MKKKILIGVAAVFCVAISVALGTSIFMGYQTYEAVNRQNALLQAQLDIEERKNEEQNTNKENDVTIGAQYKILDTSNISDAYLANDNSTLSEEMDKKTYELASAILKEIIKDGMTDYEKELAIYEWVTSNISFESGSLVAIPDVAGHCDKPYGVLQNKKAVCVGFATTFRLLCNMSGIECHVMHDSGLGHTWNIVKIEDEWYNVDCTFDASSESERYKNFNVSDIAFSQNHEWSMNIFPEAKGTTYSYATQHAEFVNDIYEIPKFIKQNLDAQDLRAFYTVKVDQESDITTMMTEIQSRMYIKYPESSLDFKFFPKDSSHFVVGVFFTHPQTTTTNQSDNYQKVVDSVVDVFGFY